MSNLLLRLNFIRECCSFLTFWHPRGNIYFAGDSTLDWPKDLETNLSLAVDLQLSMNYSWFYFHLVTNWCLHVTYRWLHCFLKKRIFIWKAFRRIFPNFMQIWLFLPFFNSIFIKKNIITKRLMQMHSFFSIHCRLKMRSFINFVMKIVWIT